MSALTAPLEPSGPMVALRHGRRVLALPPPLLELRCYAPGHCDDPIVRFEPQGAGCSPVTPCSASL